MSDQLTPGARRGARFPAILVLSVAVLAAAAPGSPGVGRWTRIGPDGGGVLSLAPHPTNPLVVFAGTYDGVYVSGDGGVTWSRRTRGDVSLPWVRWLAVDPGRTDRLYAVHGVGYERRMLRSDDGGRTWVEISRAVGEKYGRGPALLPDGTLLIADRGITLHRSRDAGRTWEKLEGAPIPVLDVAFSPSQPDIVYAADDHDVFRSEDAGDTWRVCGRPDGGRWEPERITVDAADPGLLYVPEMGSVVVSRDGCASWSRTAVPSAYWVNQMAADPLRPGTVYLGADLGLRVSRDGGATWTTVAPAVESIYPSALAPSPLEHARFLMAVEWPRHAAGIWATADAGSTWTSSVQGLDTVPVTTLLRDPAASQRLVAGSWVSENLGHTWEKLESSEEVAAVLAIASSDPDVWFASPAFSRGLLRSIDRGRTWESVATEVNAFRLTVHPTDPDRLHAGWLQSGAWAAPAESRDGGRTWTHAYVAEGTVAFTFAHDPHRSGVIWAATSVGPWRSRDDGATWTHASGLDALFIPIAYHSSPRPPALHSIGGIAVDPHDPARILGWTCDAVIRSTDGGRSWKYAHDGLSICSSRDGLWRPGCPSKGWDSPVCSGGPRSLAFDPEVPGLVYVTTANGPYRSTDGGLTWSPLPGSAGAPEMTNLQNLGDGRLLAGSSNSGVLEYREVAEAPGRPAAAE